MKTTMMGALIASAAASLLSACATSSGASAGAKQADMAAGHDLP